MDTDYLKARSIELAERAYRLRDRAQDTGLKTKLDEAGDKLINVGNLYRFLDAQDALEVDTNWPEDVRSLAHEINIANSMRVNKVPLEFNNALQVVNEWISMPGANADSLSENSPEVLYKAVTKAQDRNTKKAAINTFIAFLETMLLHTHQEYVDDSKMLYLFRELRDAFLVGRELTVDDAELLENELVENAQYGRITMERDQIDQIYNIIKQSR